LAGADQKIGYKPSVRVRINRKDLLGRRQGDQIGRIFACWAVVYSGQVFWKLQNKPQFLGLFCPRPNVRAYIFTINGLGYILGDFFTNSSGHPGRRLHWGESVGVK
jgi:hypothetical protein